MTRAPRRGSTIGTVIWIIRTALTIATWAALTGIDIHFWGVLRGIALTATAMFLIWHWRRGGAR